MIFSLVIHGTAPASYAAHSGLNFARAVIAGGHSIARVFFYHDAVRIADNNVVLPQDEVSIAQQWQKFAQDHKVELNLCIAAALRRGVLNEAEQKRYQRPCANSIAEFEVVGLGQLIEATLVADRVVTFGART
jgi:tRNA 2-thiouridine synthesizing protein D